MTQDEVLGEGERRTRWLGGVAVFLASKAGTFMSGQSIVIDGGRTIA